MRMGVALGEKILRERPDHGIDVVIPIPTPAAIPRWKSPTCWNVKYREGFIKNRYVGRTFIMPGRASARSR